MKAEHNLAALDLGTSSVRALLFDEAFAQHADLGLQKKYEFESRSHGSV